MAEAEKDTIDNERPAGVDAVDGAGGVAAGAITAEKPRTLRSAREAAYNREHNARKNAFYKSKMGLQKTGNFMSGGHVVVEWRATCRADLCMWDCWEDCEARREYDPIDCVLVKAMHEDVVASLREQAPWVLVDGADYMVTRELAANTVKLEYIRSLMNRAAGGMGGAFAAGEGTGLANLRKALGQAERRQDVLFEKMGLNPTSRAKLAVNVDQLQNRTRVALDEYEREAAAIKKKFAEGGGDGGDVVDGDYEDIDGGGAA